MTHWLDDPGAMPPPLKAGEEVVCWGGGLRMTLKTLWPEHDFAVCTWLNGQKTGIFVLSKLVRAEDWDEFEKRQLVQRHQAQGLEFSRAETLAEAPDPQPERGVQVPCAAGDPGKTI